MVVLFLRHGYTIQRCYIACDAVAALSMVVIRNQSVLPLNKYSKSNMMNSTIQIMFDQALLSNTNALF